MRHVKSISTVQSKPANEFQDAICAFASAFSAIIAAFGGSSPIAEYIDGKCAFEVPDGGGGGEA